MCIAWLQDKAAESGYIAIVEICGLNDWLLAMLPKHGCVQTILIQRNEAAKGQDRPPRCTRTVRTAVGQPTLTVGVVNRSAVFAKSLKPSKFHNQSSTHHVAPQGRRQGLIAGGIEPDG